MQERLTTTAERPRGADLEAYAEQYANQGYVLVKNLLSPEEAAAYRAECHRLLESLNRDDDPTWASAADVSGTAPTRLKHLHDAQFYSAMFSRLLVDPRFTDVVAAVLGTPTCSCTTPRCS
jgi:phytanoyl-CoA hydroxylase